MKSCNIKHWTLPYFGLIKLKILPPRCLYFPVLPMKINSKLLFPLCRTCTEKENVYEGDCTDEKCALTNTWCTPEINAVINVSYLILEIFEVLH